MQNYKVWLHARDPKTLEVVASVRVYNHEDRLAAEKVLETAQTRLQLLVLQLLHVHPGALVSTEMELPGTPQPVEILVSALDQILNGKLLWGGPNHDDNGLKDFVGSHCSNTPSAEVVSLWVDLAQDALARVPK